MRIAAKHLRYTLEALEPLYGEEIKNTIQSMRKIQDELGEIHDCDVWVNDLPVFVEKERQGMLAYYGHTRLLWRLQPGLAYFRNDRLESRVNHYQGFLDYWQNLKAKETWNKLRETIQMPFNLGQARETLTP